jgi:hypothetical protein
MAEHRSSRSYQGQGQVTVLGTTDCFDDVEHLETQGRAPGQEQGQESCSGQPPTFYEVP